MALRSRKGGPLASTNDPDHRLLPCGAGLGSGPRHARARPRDRAIDPAQLRHERHVRQRGRGRHRRQPHEPPEHRHHVHVARRAQRAVRRSLLRRGKDVDEEGHRDRYGNLWMAYLLNTDGNVPIALSTDGGLTLTKVTEIVPTKPTGSKSPKNAASKRLRGSTKGVSGDQPSISAGPNSVWVSWTSFPSTVVEASGASVSGFGQHGDFSAPEPVPTSDGKGDYGDTAV